MPNEIMTEFIEDARDHLQAAGQHLLVLEKDPSRQDELHGVMRRFHSIKGNAGFLDLKALYRLTHKAENLLQGIRETGCSPCPPDLIDVLFRVLDIIELILVNLENNESDQVPDLAAVEENLDRLEKIIETPSPALKDPRITSTQTATVRSEENKAAPPGAIPGPAEPADQDPPDRPRPETGGWLDRILRLTAEKQVPLPGLADEVELLRSDLELWAGPQARRACKLIENYLAQLHDDGPLTGVSRTLLEGLIDNLGAWLENEKVHPDNMVLVPEPGDLSLGGPNLQAQIEAGLGQDFKGLIIDLREFENLRSAEIDALIKAVELVHDRSRVVLVMDPAAQNGLIRVFKVMGLDKFFQIFGDETLAREALN